MDTQERPMTTPPRPLPIVTPRLIFGACVLVFGVILLLDTMHLVEAGRILRYWPVILMGVGAFKIVRADGTSSRVFGGVLFAIGTLVLLGNLHRIDGAMVISVGLVLLGGWLVFRALAQPVGRTTVTTDSGQTISVFSMMAGVDRKTNSKTFRGGDATALMGGCEIDLRDASIEGEAVIDVFAMWGGIEIAVPGDWTVVITATPLLGGIEDSRKIIGSDPTKRLVLRGLVLMGGVEVRN